MRVYSIPGEATTERINPYKVKVTLKTDAGKTYTGYGASYTEAWEMIKREHDKEATR